jgi:hypothetical protein
VVIKAERTAAGDHVECIDFMYPAAPDKCGTDIDVPEIILYFDVLLSPGVLEI